MFGVPRGSILDRVANVPGRLSHPIRVADPAMAFHIPDHVTTQTDPVVRVVSPLALIWINARQIRHRQDHPLLIRIRLTAVENLLSATVSEGDLPTGRMARPP